MGMFYELVVVALLGHRLRWGIEGHQRRRSGATCFGAFLGTSLHQLMTSLCWGIRHRSVLAWGVNYENIGSEGIETESYSTLGGAQTGRVVAVPRSCGGRVATPTAVNACGTWTNWLAAAVRVKIPLRAMKHAMVLTGPISGMHNG